MITVHKYADYNAFRGGLKSALHRTFLTTKGTKGAQRAQSLNLHVRPELLIFEIYVYYQNVKSIFSDHKL